MTSTRLGRALLQRSWWILFPAFGALVIRLAFERTCRDPYDLLPELMTRPGWAWLIALVYVLAHVWMVAAYLYTVSEVQTLFPSIRAVRIVWRGHELQIALMLALVAIEYCPVRIWRILGASVHCV